MDMETETDTNTGRGERDKRSEGRCPRAGWDKLESVPRARARITDANWRETLGDWAARHLPLPTAVRPAGRAGSVTPEEVFERAVAHGNEHAIKFADTALDVSAASEDGDTRALPTALNALALIDEDD